MNKEFERGYNYCKKEMQQIIEKLRNENAELRDKLDEKNVKS